MCTDIFKFHSKTSTETILIQSKLMAKQILHLLQTICTSFETDLIELCGLHSSIHVFYA